MSHESDLEDIAYGEAWKLDNLDSLIAAVKGMQEKLDGLITTLPAKWKGTAADLAVARLRAHKKNLGKIRADLNTRQALITGISEDACSADYATKVIQDEARRLLHELPGGVIPQQLHDAVNRGLKYPVPGFGIVDVNTALSEVSNFFGANREKHAEDALVALQKLAQDEEKKLREVGSHEKFDDLPKTRSSTPGGPGGIDLGSKTYDDNYGGNGYKGGPIGPGRGGNDGGGGGNTRGGGNDDNHDKRRGGTGIGTSTSVLCGVCSCRDHSGPGCGCVSSHPPVNVGPCGYPRCLCTSHSGGGCWCVPRHTLTHACGYGSCTCTNHSGPACWCVAGHVHTAPPPGPPQPPTGPNPPTNTGGGGDGGGEGTGTGGRPWANNYGNPSVDSRMDGSTMRNGLGAAGLGAAGLAAGSKLAGGGGLGAGLGGAGAVGVGGVGGAGGAAGAGGAGAGAGRGGSGLQGSASAAGKAGAAGGAGSGAAAGSGSKGAGRSGMMMGGQGGAADKKNTKRNGLGYVAPKIEDEGDGGPAAAASRAGSREP